MEQLIERVNKLATPVKAGIILGIILVLTGGNYLLVVSGTEDRIKAIKAEQTAKDQTFAQKQEIADNLNDRRKEMDKLDQDFQEALTKLPERKDIEELLAQLNDVGKKSGLEISKVTPLGESPEGFYSRIPISMAVAGNYHEIALFLQEVAGLRRIVNVSDLRLAGPSMNGEKVILKSEFKATTFRFNTTPVSAKDKKKGGK